MPGYLRNQCPSRNAAKAVISSQKIHEQESCQDGNGLLIGIAIKKYGSSYYGRMLDAAVEQLQSCGFEVIVQASDVAGYGEYRAWSSLINRGCKGVIIYPDKLSGNQFASLFKQYPNTVLINQLAPGYESSCVYVDQASGARQAGLYLLEKGHRNIAMITGKNDYRVTQARTFGFTEALIDKGIELPAELVIEGKFSTQSGADCMEPLMATGKRFTAVFVHSDEMAVGLIQALQAQGINVPQEISVIGFDDHESAAVISPGLTTIRQPIAEIGKRAAMIIQQMILGDESTKTLPVNFGRIFPMLVERQSVETLDPTAKSAQGKSTVLTERETECLQWTAAGKTSQEIAIILSMAESTVNFHMKNVFDKLNASNRVHAVALALSMSLIEHV